MDNYVQFAASHDIDTERLLKHRYLQEADFLKRRSFIALTAFIPAVLLNGCGKRPFYFIQMADTQLGMIAGGDGSDFKAETIIMEKVISDINAMSPAPVFVTVCGDMTNHTGHTAQIAEYKRLTGLLRKDIKLYNVPGNHDLAPSIESIESYRGVFGDDRYSFRHEDWLFIVINSSIIKTPDKVADMDREQKAWLAKELESVKAEAYEGSVVFMHYPFFDNNIDEDDGYHSITKARRREFLDMFADAGVKAVFSGHRHTTIPEHEYRGVKLVNTNAIGNSFDNNPGLRIAICSEKGIVQTFCQRDMIPTDPVSVFTRVKV
jgi:serine/threonine-protein phosphatase CPPED1